VFPSGGHAAASPRHTNRRGLHVLWTILIFLLIVVLVLFIMGRVRGR
jgi:hypothetical protein